MGVTVLGGFLDIDPYSVLRITLPTIYDDQIEGIFGFRSSQKNDHTHLSWHPADRLHAPNALHKFLLAINNPRLCVKEVPSKLPSEDVGGAEIDRVISIKDINGNSLGSIKDINGNSLGSINGKTDNLLRFIKNHTSLTLNKCMSYSTLSLLLSSAIQNTVLNLDICIDSDLFKKLLLFSKTSGIHPVSQIKDLLVIFVSSSVEFRHSLITCKILLFQRPLYYDKLLLNGKGALVQDHLNSKTSIKGSLEYSQSWGFVESQSLNSIYNIPRILFQRKRFRFSIHASSSLFDVQQFGRWLVLCRGAVYKGDPAQLVFSEQPDVDVIFVHHAALSMLHHQSWVPNLLRLRFGIRFFVFGTHPNALLSTPINKRVPAEILPLHGGGVTTFSLRLILAKSNESRIREYIRRTANFPGWSLLLPSGLFEALKVFIDTIRNDAAESKRLHFLRNDLFRAAYHETSKEASNAFSEMEFIIGCSKELLNKHRFFVLVDDPALASDLIPATVYERYPRLHGRVKCEPLAASSLVFVGTFSDLVSQFN